MPHGQPHCWRPMGHLPLPPAWCPPVLRAPMAQIRGLGQGQPALSRIQPPAESIVYTLDKLPTKKPGG
jgi:hypothetical protein